MNFQDERNLEGLLMLLGKNVVKVWNDVTLLIKHIYRHSEDVLEENIPMAVNSAVALAQLCGLWQR